MAEVIHVYYKKITKNTETYEITKDILQQTNNSLDNIEQFDVFYARNLNDKTNKIIGFFIFNKCEKDKIYDIKFIYLNNIDKSDIFEKLLKIIILNAFINDSSVTFNIDKEDIDMVEDISKKNKFSLVVNKFDDYYKCWIEK